MTSTLLLADDSITIQRVIELTFADEDIQVVTVSDGDQAIAELGRTPPPDIVLADVGMPGRTGYDVAQFIKDDPHLAHIPVLLLTGAFEPVDQERASAVGSSGVLAKPFEPQFVVTRVKELLSGKPGPVQVLDAPQDTTAAAAPATVSASPVAEYFDRLDEAFANLAADAGGGLKTPTSESNSELTGSASEPAVSKESASNDSSAAASRPAEVQPTVAAATQASPSPGTVPPLADAFAALLAAEQAVGTSGQAPVWPAPDSAPAVSDEVVDRVARRVLDQLNDRVVHDAVAEIVSEVAERLVREEIDRIKKAIEQ